MMHNTLSFPDKQILVLGYGNGFGDWGLTVGLERTYSLNIIQRI